MLFWTLLCCFGCRDWVCLHLHSPLLSKWATCPFSTCFSMVAGSIHNHRSYRCMVCAFVDRYFDQVDFFKLLYKTIKRQVCNVTCRVSLKRPHQSSTGSNHLLHYNLDNGRIKNHFLIWYDIMIGIWYVMINIRYKVNNVQAWNKYIWTNKTMNLIKHNSQT